MTKRRRLWLRLWRRRTSSPRSRGPDVSRARHHTIMSQIVFVKFFQTHLIDLVECDHRPRAPLIDQLLFLREQASATDYEHGDFPFAPPPIDCPGVLDGASLDLVRKGHRE